MKRVILVLSVLLLLLFSACGKTADAYRENQTVTSQATVDKSSELTVTDAAELKNVAITYKNKANIGKKIADVYIFTDSRLDKEAPSDSYLGIDRDGKMTVADLDIFEDGSYPAYSTETYIADVNGDGSDEIIVQQCIAITGGAGSYRSRVFKVDGDSNEISAILDSSSVNQFDTGFKNEITENACIRITDSFTEMSKTYRLFANNSDYIRFFYDDSGEIIQQAIMVNSFNQFTPFDVDDDGVYEIVCKQYVSLIGHADYIGTAKSVLKWDNGKGAFAVFKADFLRSEKLKDVS